MDIQKFYCPSHPANKIDFFCTANQWHFIPLCAECLPAHTQKHAKGVKVNIQNFQSVWDKHCQQRDSALSLYQQQLAKINSELKGEKKDKQLQWLQQFRVRLILSVNSFFDGIQAQVQKVRKQTKQFQKDLLLKLKENVEADIGQIKGLQSVKNVDMWVEQAKRFYYKDNVSAFIQEIQELLREHRERLYERNDIQFSLPKLNKMGQEIQKMLASAIQLTGKVANSQKQIQPEQKNPKKSTKSVIASKPKLCKVCGNQMKYLTEWKKHLICPVCGGKERNYVPKPK